MTSARSINRPRSHLSNPESLSAFVELAYGELRCIAAHYFKREPRNHTLQATALVHEVFIRLARNGPRRYANRAHFFAVASRAMRQVLVEAARKRGAGKRGGGWQRISVDELQISCPEEPDYAAIDSVLTRLTAFDSRLGQIAELRIFARLSVRDIAEVLHMTLATVRRRWAIAQAWLQRELQSLAV